MAVVGIRQLSRDTSRVIKEFEETGEPVVLTREGRPIGALMPVDREQLEDLVLATAPESLDLHERAKADFEAGRTRPLAEAAAERGIELPPREEEAAAEDAPAETAEAQVSLGMPYAIARQTLAPYSRGFSRPFAIRMLQDASEQAGALSKEALGAIGKAEEGELAEKEVREVTEQTAAVYGQLFRRNLILRYARGDFERALEGSRRQTTAALRSMGRSLADSGNLSVDGYVASLRGLRVAWESEAESEEAPTPLPDTIA